MTQTAHSEDNLLRIMNAILTGGLRRAGVERVWKWHIEELEGE